MIYSEDVEHIFGKRQWISRSQEILQLQEKANEKAAEEQAKADDNNKQPTAPASEA